MKVPQRIQNRWKLQYEHGDIEEIHKKSGISRKTISDAMRTGQTSEETMEAINKYNASKKEKEKKLVEDFEAE